jgi:mRNA interferase YafQ
MIYTPVYTRQFERDIKRLQRRGKNIEKFKIIARTLLAGEPLDAIHRDRRLVGNYAGRRECHLESDWLLICKTEESRLIFDPLGRAIIAPVHGESATCCATHRSPAEAERPTCFQAVFNECEIAEIPSDQSLVVVSPYS